LFFIAEYLNIIMMSFFIVILFFGGWLPMFGNSSDFSAFFFFIKFSFIFFSFIWVRASLPRFRYDQLMRLSWKVFLPLALSFFVIVSTFILLYTEEAQPYYYTVGAEENTLITTFLDNYIINIAVPVVHFGMIFCKAVNLISLLKLYLYVIAIISCCLPFFYKCFINLMALLFFKEVKYPWNIEIAILRNRSAFAVMFMLLLPEGLLLNLFFFCRYQLYCYM